MLKNKLGEDSPIPKLIHLKIRRRDGVESLTNLEEISEFKVPSDGCINRNRLESTLWNDIFLLHIREKRPYVGWKVTDYHLDKLGK